MKKITSADNPRLKSAIRLKTTRGRKTQRRIIVFGYREIQRATESGIQPLEIFLSSESLSQEHLDWVATAVKPPTTLIYDLPPSLMSKLRYGERQDAMVAVAARPRLSLEELTLPANPIVVILESVEKPGNIGAILRTIDGAGADALLLADPQCDVLHPNCVRASQGSVFNIPLAIGTSDQIYHWCLKHAINMVATSNHAATRYTEANFCDPTAVIFGNEASGLTQRWLTDPVQSIAIPMQGIADSLNVSVSAGVILYEARRQRDALNS